MRRSLLGIALAIALVCALAPAALGRSKTVTGPRLTVGIDEVFGPNVKIDVQTPARGSIDVMESAWKNDQAHPTKTIDAHASSAFLLQPARGRFVYGRLHVNTRRAGRFALVVAPNPQGLNLFTDHRYPVQLRVWITFTPTKGTPDTIGLKGITIAQ